MVKVTIIVSAHKERGFLYEALDSAMGQPFNDYEIILSSDGNAELETVAKKYDIKFCLSPKKNHSAALNNAVKMAKGEWIKECHDDDFLTINCLQDLWNCREDADIVYANAVNFRDGEHSGRIYKPPPIVTLQTFLPVIHNPVHAATIFFKRQMFLDVGGFDPECYHAEEYEFYLNIITKGYRFKYCDSTVAWYRLHPGQDTYLLNAKRAQMQEYINNKFKGYAGNILH